MMPATEIEKGFATMAKRKKVLQRDPFGRELSTFEEEEDDALDARGLLRDGRSLRVPLFLKDGAPNPELTPLQRAVAETQTRKPLVTDGGTDPLAMHRPGFRVSTNPRERMAADAALTEAYEARELADREAWRSSDDYPLNDNARGTSRSQREGDSCSIDGQRGRLKMVNGALQCVADRQQDAQLVDERELAYLEYENWSANAWRNP
jgi:hypothetical protein